MRAFGDPTLQGMRTLEVWAGKDEKHRFEVRWDGPRRVVQNVEVGGYTVSVWISPNKKSRIYRVGRTLHDAAVEATKAVEE